MYSAFVYHAFPVERTWSDSRLTSSWKMIRFVALYEATERRKPGGVGQMTPRKLDIGRDKFISVKTYCFDTLSHSLLIFPGLYSPHVVTSQWDSPHGLDIHIAIYASKYSQFKNFYRQGPSSHIYLFFLSFKIEKWNPMTRLYLASNICSFIHNFRHFGRAANP